MAKDIKINTLRFYPQSLLLQIGTSVKTHRSTIIERVHYTRNDGRVTRINRVD